MADGQDYLNGYCSFKLKGNDMPHSLFERSDYKQVESLKESIFEDRGFELHPRKKKPMVHRFTQVIPFADNVKKYSKYQIGIFSTDKPMTVGSLEDGFPYVTRPIDGEVSIDIKYGGVDQVLPRTLKKIGNQAADLGSEVAITTISMSHCSGDTGKKQAIRMINETNFIHTMLDFEDAGDIKRAPQITIKIDGMKSCLKSYSTKLDRDGTKTIDFKYNVEIPYMDYGLDGFLGAFSSHEITKEEAAKAVEKVHVATVKGQCKFSRNKVETDDGAINSDELFESEFSEFEIQSNGDNAPQSLDLNPDDDGVTIIDRSRPGSVLEGGAPVDDRDRKLEVRR